MIHHGGRHALARTILALEAIAVALIVVLTAAAVAIR